MYRRFSRGTGRPRITMGSTKRKRTLAPVRSPRANTRGATIAEYGLRNDRKKSIGGGSFKGVAILKSAPGAYSTSPVPGYCAPSSRNLRSR